MTTNDPHQMPPEKAQWDFQYQGEVTDSPRAYPPPPNTTHVTGYPVPQFPQPPVNGFAIAALVLGIVWLFWLGSLLAIVFGHTALDQINKRGTTSGKGLAVAGLVLGYVGAGTFTLFFVLPALLGG